MNENIGGLIAGGRKAKGMTQARFARLLHISPQAVGKWERGESLPDIFTFVKISDILEIDGSVLLGQKGKTKKCDCDCDCDCC